MENVVKFIYAVIVWLGGIVISAYTVVLLWGWFITPVFNIQSPTLAQASGLGLIAGYFISRPTKDTLPFYNIMGFVYAKAIVAMGLGWIIYQFT